jgi:UDP-GlcNAc:undecaprenyl-phosphate/decaprenyl-phosphate GlcNAc-1-phosphate transferase
VSDRLEVENYRGARIVRSLGLVIVGAAWIATFAWSWIATATATAWGALAGCVLIFAAGLVDDLVPGGPRGLRNHARAVSEGRVTTGIVKVVIAVGAAVVVVALEPSRAWWVRLFGVVLVASATNVWNGLDVRPGRALKAFAPIGVLFVLFADVSVAPAVLGVAVAALVVMPMDLLERAMLGDGGATLLGFAAGVALYVLLPGWAVVLVALAMIALNVVAETMSFSHAIDAVPALRWLDRLGRRPEATD